MTHDRAIEWADALRVSRQLRERGSHLNNYWNRGVRDINETGWARGYNFDDAKLDREAAELLAALAAQGEAGDELEKMRARKDAAYDERNKVVAALAKLFPSGTARTNIPGWSDDWHGCVYIDLPTGQVSWHYHDSQAYLFANLPPYAGVWDGHDTPEKYRRLAALPPAQGEAMPVAWTSPEELARMMNGARGLFRLASSGMWAKFDEELTVPLYASPPSPAAPPATGGEALYCSCESPMILCDHRGCRCERCGKFERVAALSTRPTPAPAPDQEALRDVATERRRQVESEGWTPEHDDMHRGGEMAMAAAAYAYFAALSEGCRKEERLFPRIGSVVSRCWPSAWGNWWKPKDRRRDLVRAGALIIAEIERLDRATAALDRLSKETR